MTARKKAAKKKVAKKASKVSKQATDFTPESLGREAEQLLGNETFTLALNYVESRALGECRMATNAEEAYRGTLKSQAVQEIRQTLHAYISQGQAAAERAFNAAEEVRNNAQDTDLLRSYKIAAQAARAEADSHFSNGGIKQ